MSKRANRRRGPSALDGSREAAKWAEVAMESDAELARCREEAAALQRRVAELELEASIRGGRQAAPSLPAPAEEALALVDPCEPATYLRAVEAAFPDRVAVLPDAVESASELEQFDPSETWRMVMSVPTVLWPLAFADAKADGRLSAMYQERAGFELSRGEGGTTRKNRRLAKLREKDYMSRTVDVSMHVKSGTRRNPVRLYLALDRLTGKVVIGEMTTHLETAGSARKGHKR